MTARSAVIITCLSAGVLLRVIDLMTDFPRDSFLQSIKDSRPEFKKATVGENGAFPPTRNGCIHSLSMRERG